MAQRSVSQLELILPRPGNRPAGLRDGNAVHLDELRAGLGNPEFHHMPVMGQLHGERPERPPGRDQCGAPPLRTWAVGLGGALSWALRSVLLSRSDAFPEYGGNGAHQGIEARMWGGVLPVGQIRRLNRRNSNGILTGSIIAGTRMARCKPSAASAFTQFEATELSD